MKVERDLNHWKNIRKWPEYRDTPGPQHDYQKVALSARPTEATESFMFKSKVSNCQNVIPTEGSTFNGQVIDKIQRLQSEVKKQQALKQEAKRTMSSQDRGPFQK